MSADKTELRGMAPIDLVQALDAIAISRSMDRTALVNQILTEQVKRITHEATLVVRMTRDNALVREAVAESKTPTV